MRWLGVVFDLDCFGAFEFGPEEVGLASELVAGLEAALGPDRGKR